MLQPLLNADFIGPEGCNMKVFNGPILNPDFAIECSNPFYTPFRQPYTETLCDHEFVL
jgi:hypothetical protein